MQDSIGWALLHLSLISSCQDWPECLYSLPAVTNCRMPGMHGTRYAPANTLPSRLGPSEPVSVTECSICTSSVALGHNRDWYGLCWPRLCVCDVPTSVEKHVLASKMGKEKDEWHCAILPDALPQRAMLSIISMCLAAPACSSLFTPDEARRQPS